MAHQLADETLAVILQQCLVVPDKDFACTNARMSPFSRIEHPSSDYLVVCKRWTRISTPLLYHTVVLRSQPQATALAAVLKPKANARFGQYIRKFRVEGGFGVAVKNILLVAPNITDLCVRLDLSAKDNVGPMCDILLTAVRPQRLVISMYSNWPKMNKQTRRLCGCLAQCIKDWTTLTHLTLSEEVLEQSELGLRPVIFASLTLQEIALPPDSGSLYMACELAEAAFAPRVILPQRLSDASPIARWRFDKLSPTTQAKVIFDPELEASRVAATAAAIEATSNPFFVPLVGVPTQLACTIWTFILRAALALPRDVPQSRNWFGLDMSSSSDSDDLENTSKLKEKRPTRAMEYMLVCRSWLSIIRTIAAERVTTSNPTTLQSFSQYVASSAQPIGTHSLIVYPTYLGIIEEHPAFAAALAPPLERLNELRQVTATIGLGTTAWNALNRTSCFTLTVLEVAVASGEFNMVCMPVLRTLRITAMASPAQFSAEHNCVFPAVTELKVDDYTSGATLLRFLASTRLPSLSSVVFNTLKRFIPRSSSYTAYDISSVAPRMTTFLMKHGASLSTLSNQSCSFMLETILDTCPNLTTLRLRADYYSYLNPPPPISNFHLSLETIKIGAVRIGREALRPDWLKFFDSLKPETMPALRLVISSQADLWPTQPRDVAKHPMPPIAEALLERGIKLCDVDGVGWKPRLQTRRAKKSSAV